MATETRTETDPPALQDPPTEGSGPEQLAGRRLVVLPRPSA